MYPSLPHNQTKMTIPEAVGDQMTTVVEIPKTEDASKPKLQQIPALPVPPVLLGLLVPPVLLGLGVLLGLPVPPVLLGLLVPSVLLGLLVPSVLLGLPAVPDSTKGLHKGYHLTCPKKPR